MTRETTGTRAWPCGHPRTPENTKIRRCRVCQQALDRKYRGSARGLERDRRYNDSVKGTLQHLRNRRRETV